MALTAVWPSIYFLLCPHFFPSLITVKTAAEAATIANRTSAAGKIKPADLKALWNLNGMVECRLHYTALEYNNYGCWCGIGGSGQPMDGIDTCCMAHDKCYDAAVDNKVCYDTEWEYVDPYSWSCQSGEPICSPTAATGCSTALCACDKQVVDCWAQFPKPNVTTKCSHSSCSGHFLDRIVGALRSVVKWIAGIFSSDG